MHPKTWCDRFPPHMTRPHAVAGCAPTLASSRGGGSNDGTRHARAKGIHPSDLELQPTCACPHHARRAGFRFTPRLHMHATLRPDPAHQERAPPQRFRVACCGFGGRGIVTGGGKGNRVGRKAPLNPEACTDCTDRNSARTISADPDRAGRCHRGEARDTTQRHAESRHPGAGHGIRLRCGWCRH